MDTQLSYWAALAHTSNVKTAKKNEIIVRLHERKLDIADFFEFDRAHWQKEFDLSPKEVERFEESKAELPNYAFMVEDLLEQGYHIVPITSEEYSATLKKNLKKRYAPPLLYAKGNLELMHADTVAIVGSRKADDRSLEFTDNVAKKAVGNSQVVVSGFAKGVDKQALESALTYGGRSIVALPQGIATFTSGYKKYYQQIIQGKMLVLSAFHPRAPWSVALAMARNPIIYGLATEIYVAESSDKGGTWSGVIDGLRKNRTILIRKPRPDEKNANEKLIAQGGKPVDEFGELYDYAVAEGGDARVAKEPQAYTEPTDEKILEFLKTGAHDAKTIVEKLDLDRSSAQVTSWLKKHPDIKIIKDRRPFKFIYDADRPDKQIKIDYPD